MFGAKSADLAGVGFTWSLGARAGLRRCGAVVILTALLLTLVAVAPNPAAAAMRVRIDPPMRAHSGEVYRVHVISAGTPILILTPGQTLTATLEVNGTVEQAMGSKSEFGLQPFGKSVVSLQLSNLTSRDTIRIITTGERGGSDELRVVDNESLISAAARTGLLTGCFLMFLLLITLFHVLHAVTMHERANFWYAGWASAVFVASIVRDGYFGTGTTAVTVDALSGILIGVSVTEFTITYLRLRSDAPRLRRCIIAVNVFFGLMFMIAGAVIHSAQYELITSAKLFGILSLLVAAILRWRAGFTPAAPLAAGLFLLSATFATMLAFAGRGSPLLYAWGLQAAAAFDLSFFAIALSVRHRYTKNERAVLEAQLHESLFAATHDMLTGLLNRRGLDEWLQKPGTTVANVFFIDLDGFKTINDRGGHATGDDALRIVSRIIRRTVRECDAVARIGGDEFVVAFSGDQRASELEVLQERIHLAVSALEPLGSNDATRIGASIGIGIVDKNATIEDAMRAADADAYRVKFEHYAHRREQATR